MYFDAPRFYARHLQAFAAQDGRRSEEDQPELHVLFIDILCELM